MATDNGRIKAALKSIDAVEFDGEEKDAALAALRKLDGAEGRRRGSELRHVNEVLERARNIVALAESVRKCLEESSRGPEPLFTEASYTHAPIGTVVQDWLFGHWTKGPNEIWANGSWNFKVSATLAGKTRRVTKWGGL